MSPAIIRPRRIGDARGWFCETFSARRAAELGIHDVFVQDNHSYSAAKGTMRGIHFQTPPHAQAKLVRCVRGAIWDVVVDLRTGSPTYGQWVADELSADNGAQMYVPVGYGHGFVTLTADCEVVYKTSDYYAPECDAGIAWDDPGMAIAWPGDPAGFEISDKDRRQPTLAQFASPFAYEGAPLEALTA